MMRTRSILAASVAAVLCAALPVSPAGAAAPGSCGQGTPDASFVGSFDASLQGSYVQVPFDVPAGMTRLRVRLCHDQPPTPLAGQIKNTLDLGLYQPSGDGVWDAGEFRGWGGSSRLDVLITPEASTTVGFLPGDVQAGTWAAEIGVAAVVGPDGGNPDARVSWRLEVLYEHRDSDLDEPFAPAPYDTTPARASAGWYKGDFHVHARNSNPADASMRDVFDYAFSDRPTGAGLDFVTLSDYVTTRQWDEIGAYQADHPGKLIVRSAEVITYRGHVNNHGSARYVDYRTGPVYTLVDGTLARVRDARPASRIFDDIHAAGGWTQVNHPTTFPSKVPAFANLCRGCSWEYTDGETDWDRVDAMEVQTGPAGYTDPKGNEPGPNPFTPPAIAWWDSLRRDGHRVTAVGSSDSHKANREDLTTSPIGEATTVVYATELSEAGIGAAVRAGHAYVKFFSSDGPDLRFEAAGAGGERAIMGDTVAGPASLTARVLGAAPTAASPQPRVMLVLRDGVPMLAAPVTSADFELTLPAGLPGSYRLQLQRGSAIEALTNPITVS